MRRQYYVYILASKPNGTLYIGVTNNLIARLDEHRTGNVRWDPPEIRSKPKHRRRAKAFAFRHGCYRLVYYESFYYILDAIAREKQLKEWRRTWKIRLIQKDNPGWYDRSSELLGHGMAGTPTRPMD